MARTWVLMRGLIREQRHWEGFGQQLAAAFPNDRIVMVDLPGNGRAHRQASPTRIEAMVAAVRTDLSQRGLRPPFHVLALSLGGMVAINWMSEYPGEVAAAALLNSSVSRFSPFWHRLQPHNYGTILKKGLLAKTPLIREQAVLSMTTNLLSESQRAEVARRWCGYAVDAPVSRRNALRQLFAAARFRAPIRLPSEVPVLIIAGGEDRMVNPACSRAMARGWGVSLKLHPRAGHDITLDAGDWVTETLTEWLAEAAIAGQ